jgi:hypothetical protein
MKWNSNNTMLQEETSQGPGACFPFQELMQTNITYYEESSGNTFFRADRMAKGSSPGSQ